MCFWCSNFVCCAADPKKIRKYKTGVDEVWENEKHRTSRQEVIMDVAPIPTDFYPCSEDFFKVQEILDQVEVEERRPGSDDTASVSDASTQTEWATGWDAMPCDVVGHRNAYEDIEDERIMYKGKNNIDCASQHYERIVLTDFWDVINCNVTTAQSRDAQNSVNFMGVPRRVRKKRHVRSMTAMDPEVQDLKRELARVTLNCDYFVQHYLRDKDQHWKNSTSGNVSPPFRPPPARSNISLTASEGCVCCFGTVSRKQAPSRTTENPVSSTTWRESSESQFLSSSFTSRSGQSETSSSLSLPNPMCARCGGRFGQEPVIPGEVESSPSPRRRHYSQGSSFRRAVRRQILRQRAQQIEMERGGLTTDDDLCSPTEPEQRLRRASIDVPDRRHANRSQYVSLSHYLVEQAECGQTQFTRDVLHITAV